ncbi:hypothetical protein [Cohnella sp.]|uniref:hypothetical protein n=1 Tax=Cohnella sp. TaxID=1883426 RepID=UPI0035690BCD
MTLIYVQFILTNMAFYSIMFGIPSYLQRVQMMDAQQAGLVMLSIAGFSVIVTPLVAAGSTEAVPGRRFCSERFPSLRDVCSCC